MKSTGNVIFITGGGTGIGRAFAEAFHALGNNVIIAGRRQLVLEQVCAANPGMRHIAFDSNDTEDMQRVREHLAQIAPTLNVLINNAGIQRVEHLLQKEVDDFEDIEATIETNLIGPMRLTTTLLPQIVKQANSAIINVTSGLAFVPLSGVPSYSASKAGMHAYTLALRQQLKSRTDTQVIEVIPPYVQTDLGPSHGVDPNAMPLADFMTEVMQILRDNSQIDEVVVGRCKPLRFAAESGQFDTIFMRLNTIGPVGGLPQ